LATDVIVFLKSLQETGEVKDEMGRVVASLRDAHGKAYPNLVAEYVAHELLESTELSHDAIIALTSSLFGYGVYRGSGIASAPHARTRVFTRPGETPLGQALRMFIEKEFEKWWRPMSEKWVHLSVFDSTFQSVQFLQGVVTRVSVPPGRTEPILTLSVGEEEVDLPAHRIVRAQISVARIVGTFPAGARLTTELIEHQLHTKSFVNLTEPEARQLADITSPTPSWLNKTLYAIYALRDEEGRRIRDHKRLSLERAEAILSWAEEFSVQLGFIDLSIMVGHKLSLNDTIQPVFSLMRTTVPWLGSEEDRYTNIAHHVVNALLNFTHLKLATDKRNMRFAPKATPSTSA
jgi:hypothetical protein